MNALLGLLIVAAATSAPTRRVRHPEAVTLFECGFEETWDKNFDAWPDRWTRRRGPGYPHYLDIKISEEPSAEAQRCLRMKLDGGAATVHSPAIDVESLYSYVLEAQLKTEGLEHNEAYCTITFYDEKRTPLETISSGRFVLLRDWTKLRIGPVTPGHEEVRYAVIGLHLMPRGEQKDLVGSALFDDIWLARLPRMTLESNSNHNVFTEFDQAKMTCSLSGIAEANPRVTFELYDAWDQLVAESERRLPGKLLQKKKVKSSFLLGEDSSDQASYAGETSWVPPVKDYGYYRVKVKIEGRKGIIHQDELSLAYVFPHQNAPGGEFGWSLPRGDETLALAELAQLLRVVGINWAKFPVWFSVKDQRRVERLAWFAERLSLHNIELVGVLTNPPEDIREHLGIDKNATAATVFSVESALWRPSLEPILTRLSLKMRWWQLGEDRDTSFVGYPDLESKLRNVKTELSKFGQEVHLGIGWRWVNELPNADNPPWEFMSLSADPALTPRELATYLSGDKESKGQRWVVIEPLARSEYSLETRATDLVNRMMAAKMYNADAIYIPDPFSVEHGLMTQRGTPAELLLPWRTMAMALAGSSYVGSVALPGGSHNRIFSRDGKATMIVWSDRPTEEVVYLGDDVQHVDIWGRRLSVGKKDHRQVIQVSAMPTIVNGVSEAIARWRMSFAFSKTKIPSVFRRPHGNSFSVRNPFDQGASGQVTLVTPSVWRTYPRTSRLNMATGETLNAPFTVTLPFGASSGEHKVRVDFDVNLDRRYQFSVYRQLDVGIGDVTLEVAADFDESGDLLVTQHVTNHTSKQVRFKCYLHLPRRQRMQTLVQMFGRGRNTQTYRVSNAKDLVGEDLLIRAEEIGSQRVLNYHVQIKK